MYMCRAFLIAQLVKNLPAMQQALPEEGKGYPLQYSGLENSADSTCGLSVGLSMDSTWVAKTHT